jgi:hypothetical protein
VVLSKPRLASVRLSKVLPIHTIAEEELGNRSLTDHIGWDEGVIKMELGEKATLDITR